MVCIKDRFAICLFVCFKGSAMVCLLPDKSNLYLQCSPSVGIAKYDLEYKISPLAPSKPSRHLNLITKNSLVSNSKLCTLWFASKTGLQFVCLFVSRVLLWYACCLTNQICICSVPQVSVLPNMIWNTKYHLWHLQSPHGI